MPSSTKRRRYVAWSALVLLALLAALLAPGLLRAYWSFRSSNPVRRGVQKARELGCFSCHGDLGRAGLPDPGGERDEVPAWDSGVAKKQAQSDDDIRAYILEGTGGEPPSLVMPAFERFVSDSEVEDLVAAFKILAGMSVPPSGSAERSGYRIATRWKCFSCHNAGGAGGLPNPGSLTGYVPGWYGTDFEDLVRDREEFDAWILTGGAPRLRASRLASYFTRRQRLSMPSYAGMPPKELDDLWAYVRWLNETGGGRADPAGR